FKKAEGMPSRDLGERDIDGIKARGFEVAAGPMIMAVWADPKTELPILVEVTQAAIKSTFTHFNWNPTVDPADLKTEVPPGYNVMLMSPSASTRPATNAGR